MKRFLHIFIAAIFVLFWLIGCAAKTEPPISVSEEDEALNAVSATETPSESSPEAKPLPEKNSLQGEKHQNQWYFSLSELMEELPMISLSEKEGRMTAEGLSVSYSVGAPLLQANGRAFYSDTPAVLLRNGSLLLSAEAAERLFGWKSEDGKLTLGQTVVFPKSGDRVYDTDTLYWLSRIISAESRGEPLIGQIAVGNVVANRVRSSAYPNTYWGVIFDKNGGVQFSPVLDGSVYNAPTASSVLAAKAVLEGYSVSESILFFMEPKKSASFWIPKNRTFAFTIGHHDFYL